MEETKQIREMLEYETQIFKDIVEHDGLVITAKGLTLDYVLLNLFEVYCDPGNLVIVLNSSEAEEHFFTCKLNSSDHHRITFKTSTAEREDVYLSGGIIFITTRILVVDMLKKRLPIEKITGIVVLRAHSILESCQEAFVLRLYRQHNKTGFIKGFSNSAQSFTVGFGQVERVMRTIFVKELFIWPRFHSLVIQSLKKHQPDVVEIHVPISSSMFKIQGTILDLMNLTVKELRRINKTLELQEITVENCLTKNFQKILEMQLDSVWHQLSAKSKQLINDLKTLRHLIINLFNLDPVNFYSNVCKYRSLEYAQQSNWVLMEPAEILFTYTNSLVFKGNKELNPELCPKWKCLTEILKVEIPEECKRRELNKCSILILCQDTMTCNQLNHVLSHGPQHYLFSMALRNNVPYKSVHKSFSNVESLQHFSQSDKASQSVEFKKPKLPDESTKDGEENSSEKDELFTQFFKSSYVLTMSQANESFNESDASESEYVFEPFPEEENLDLTQIYIAAQKVMKPTILIQTFKPPDEYTNLQLLLDDIQPNFIILYHSNMTAIRQIELFKARLKDDCKMKVYFLVHNDTVEEQSYLTSLRKEKVAFEYLIETKSNMAVPDDQDGKAEHCANLQNEISPVNTRKGGRSEEGKGLVIVDMREFRSELPALIHKRGITIEPLTITVGDYILTSEICVERKSLSDLIGSLNSGRLYQQCTQMSRCYTKPMLLIEFDQNRPFSWQSNFMLSNDTKSFDIQKKLLLLTLHFPKLKIVWSSSPYASAQLFEELKEGKEQPSVQYALSIGGEHDLDTIETKYNSQIYDFIQKLPGITSKNIDIILRKFKNMDEVLSTSENELSEIIGSNDAKLLYSILHNEHLQENTETTKFKSKTKCKYKFSKGKK